MEEAAKMEKLEKTLSKKVQDTVKGLRETLGVMTAPLAKKTPTKVTVSVPAPETLASPDSGCLMDTSTADPCSVIKLEIVPVDSAAQPQPVVVKTEFPEPIVVQPTPKPKKHSKKDKSKKKKGTTSTTPAADLMGQPSYVEESRLQINVTSPPEDDGDQSLTTPPLKLKLVLSPTTEAPMYNSVKVEPGTSYDMGMENGGGVLQIAEPAPRKVGRRVLFGNTLDNIQE